MAGLGETPNGNRVHIAFFGLRNAGKSTLVNAFCGQEIAIVDATPGTTTDPVSKAMEILPLGPCLITDTAGLDDKGRLGELRVRKTMEVLATTDVAVWVSGDTGDGRDAFFEECRRRKISVLEYRRGDEVEELKRKIAALGGDDTPGLLDGLVKSGDRVVMVCPIDGSAPKGRLILPQVQVLRECLDRHAIATVVQSEEFVDTGDLVITDSQAFGKIKAKRLTSFSLLFARQKGDLDEYANGLAAAKALKDGDRVLVAEACTHHRQCNDIGTTKIPKALKRLSGAQLEFVFASGNDFPVASGEKFALVVHCGGCMLTRRQMMARIDLARKAATPIVNYGMLLQAAAGVKA